ncbi:MAG: CoA transferase [Clostridia bacterium]|jgi:crotonobetainyl-CoA:carnitine CoA-transferase CaiB-like acyl-CoA transferase|nr:CoA transferase [Clostridia bacterium]MCI1999780.1 CoA transferase [Clostridia bacterium]MCI2014304.1 CoA transferase [Clostridia bacterium]
MKPLNGIIVLDFSQYLSGPSAALRLADLGARVIKIERPKSGDSSRRMCLHNLKNDGDSVLFQTINRNKESFCANLKSEDDLKLVKDLIKKSDVVIENFRPGVMKKMGLGYTEVSRINPRIIYGSVTGYGKTGPLNKKPGQDLLVQSMSGLAWLNGNDGQPPMPFPLSVADSYAGVHLAEGILACVFRRFRTGKGGYVEVSLLESILDLQFEVITTYLNDGRKAPKRSKINNAHAYLSAPYGIYKTKDGYIALAMGSILELADIFNSDKLKKYSNKEEWFTKRDEIKAVISDILLSNTTNHWLEMLERNNYWCADVYSWDKLMNSDAFKELKLLINVKRPNCKDLITTRCPITFDDKIEQSQKWAPRLGENTQQIIDEFKLGGRA